MIQIARNEIIEGITVKVIDGQYGILKKDVNTIINMLFEEIESQLIAGNNVIFKNFGIFKIIDTKDRIGRNPKTGEPIQIPARKKPIFKASKTLIKACNN